MVSAENERLIEKSRVDDVVCKSLFGFVPSCGLSVRLWRDKISLVAARDAVVMKKSR